MNKTITHYDILEVSPDATKEEIRKAYKEGIKITHPDRHGGKGGHLFILIEEAWRVLGNDDLRAQYDAALKAEEGAGAGASSTQEEYAEPEWGQEGTWEDDLPIDDSGPTSPTSDYADYDTGGTVVPQPRFSVAETSWANSALLQQPEVFLPSKKKWILPAALTAALLAVFFAFFSIAKDEIGLLSLAFMIPSLWLVPYAILHQKANKVNTFAPFFALGGGILAFGWFNAVGVPKLQLFFTLALLGLAFLALPAATSWHWHKYFLHRRRLKDSFTMEEANIKVLGRPGEGLVEALDKFGRQNVDLGVLGEQMTGDVLEGLLAIPGVRIIHGLRFPGSDKADVDHAVIYGNKVALVDSKMWKPGKYSWNNRGEVVKNLGYRDLETITHFPTAVEKYAQLLPNAQVAGFILIHPNEKGSITVDNTYSSAASHVALGTAQLALDSIGSWFVQDSKENIVDRHLLWKVWQHKQ